MGFYKGFKAWKIEQNNYKISKIIQFKRIN